MSLLTQASPFNTVEGKPEKMKSNMMDAFKRIQSEQQNNNINNNVSDPQSLQYLRSSKVEQQSTMESVKPQPINDGDRLTDFVIPPTPPINSDLAKTNANANANTNIRNTPVSYSNHNNGSSFSQSYGSTPYYKGIAQQGGGTVPDQNHSNGQLMEKLNYMIHLLEEQQKEPTQNIMEEFALYGLLGVFMIYIVDSFARVGKYTR